jgi:hypothetical protein
MRDASGAEDGPPPQTKGTPLKKLRKVRKMTWVLVGWCTLILVWAIAGSASAASESSISDCVRDSSGILTRADCQSAAEAGAGLGFLAVLFIGFFGFVFFGLIWFMSRPKEKQVVYIERPATADVSD